jgi:hypothetical protein
LEQRKAASQPDIASHWRVENGELVNDGNGPLSHHRQVFREF